MPRTAFTPAALTTTVSIGLLAWAAACNPPAGPAREAAETVCAPTGTIMGGIVTDPNGPYYHQVLLAATTDGITLTGAHVVLDHASVPDGVRLADGRVFVYYVNGADGGIWVAAIEADTARVMGPIVINGVSNPVGVVDPDAMVSFNGKLRLTYKAHANTAIVDAICMAESDDGVHFTALVSSTTSIDTSITDPSLVRSATGTWVLAMSRGTLTFISTSNDGQAFQSSTTLAGGGVPELAILSDGSLRLYVCANGIRSFRSTTGVSWTSEAAVVSQPYNGKINVCDPSLVAGAGLFLFKTQR